MSPKPMAPQARPTLPQLRGRVEKAIEQAEICNYTKPAILRQARMDCARALRMILAPAWVDVDRDQLVDFLMFHIRLLQIWDVNINCPSDELRPECLELVRTSWLEIRRCQNRVEGLRLLVSRAVDTYKRGVSTTENLSRGGFQLALRLRSGTPNSDAPIQSRTYDWIGADFNLDL